MNRTALTGGLALAALVAAQPAAAAGGGAVEAVWRPKPHDLGRAYADWERRKTEGRLWLTQARPERVGRAPEEEGRPPPLPAAAGEKAGVLTRRGTLVIEPAIEYQHTDMNRFVVGGVAILETVLIGVFEATQADRDAVTGSIAARYGLTDRLEIETRIPYIYRNDSVTNTILETDTTAAQTSLSDHGLGDIEIAGRYQLNDGEGGWPFMVGSVRVKSTTGTGPFDVARNPQGIEQELPTGSGFWAVEPGLTFILPSDPAVFYANLGYQWNVGRDVDERVGDSIIGHVDPGDAVRLGFGIGIALNQQSSLSLGYSHDFIFATETEINGAGRDSESLSVGALSIGVSYQVNEQVAINLNVAAGVTEDAPDARVMLRVPVSFNLL